MTEKNEHKEKAAEIIHDFAIASATAAAAFSSGAVFSADSVTLTALHLEMAEKIGDVFSQKIDRGTAQELLKEAMRKQTGVVLIGKFT